ncbi:hypothetical protein [Flavobacterium luminosum]|uniref:DUF3379 domain-containing protein n=1 Tax=Flavobacterium luminosum TaxID=2949086 RepID=A0ABT0TMJ8_9FLAO|nr:hypothetical protein [Flavobacterium sp. HXWNR70]MCL9808701.1 hypothetical protein [Flavobacterium sp. HXWNR70]
MKPFDLQNDPKITSGFKTPDKYFDTFEDRLMQKLDLTKQEEIKVLSLWQRKAFWYSGVAAILMIALGTWMYFTQNSVEEMIFPSEYLAHESDITTEEIAVYLTDEDIAAIENEMNVVDETTETYINEYLN